MTGEATERAERPEVLDGFTRRIRVGCGNLYVTITTLDDGTPFECFAALGKAGGCPAAAVEAVARLVTDLLRCGADVDVPLKTLVGISCHNAMPGGDDAPQSCFDAIATTLQALRDKLRDEADEEEEEPQRQHEPHHMGVGHAPNGEEKATE